MAPQHPHPEFSQRGKKKGACRSGGAPSLAGHEVQSSQPRASQATGGNVFLLSSRQCHHPLPWQTELWALAHLKALGESVAAPQWEPGDLTVALNIRKCPITSPLTGQITLNHPACTAELGRPVQRGCGGRAVPHRIPCTFLTSSCEILSLGPN